MNIVHYLLASSIAASCVLTTVQGQGPDHVPEITSNATSVDVTDDDIAHFTCSARGQPTPSISWLRLGKNLTNNDKVKIFSTNESGLVSSHLSVAVTAARDRRGGYVCVASNKYGETERTFVIKGECPPLCKMSCPHGFEDNEDGCKICKCKQDTFLTQIAIALSVGLSVVIFGAVAFFLIRAQWRLRNNREEAHVVSNSAVPGTPALTDPPHEESPPASEETPMIHTTCV